MARKKIQRATKKGARNNTKLNDQPKASTAEGNPVVEAIDNFTISIEGIRETAPLMEHMMLALIPKHKLDFENE